MNASAISKIYADLESVSALSIDEMNARVGGISRHIPNLYGPIPHVGGSIVGPGATILPGALKGAEAQDPLITVGPPDTINPEASMNFTDGLPAARMGDSQHPDDLLGPFTIMIGG